MALLPSTIGNTTVTSVQLKTDIEKIVGYLTEIDTVAQGIDDGIIQTTNSFESEVRTVSGSISDVNALAPIAQALGLLGANLTNLNAIAADLGGVLNVSNNMATVLLLKLRMVDLMRIAASADNIDLVGENTAGINSVVSGMPEITNVVAHMADILKVSANLGYTLKYLGAHTTDPLIRSDSTPLEDGDYYLNTNLNTLKYYNLGSTSWLLIDVVAVLDAADAAAISALAAEADKIQTGLDRIATAADVVTTGSDVVTTNADVVSTTADALSTASDVVSTNADVLLTNADLIATNADRVAIETLYDTFDDRYLGTKATDPTLDNDGAALLIGAIYFNSTTNTTRFYNGVSWEVPEVTSTTAATTATNKALEASNSAAAALVSEGLADADRVATNADVILTAASEAAAALSASTATTQAGEAVTSASSASTSAVNTAADAVQTALDKVATNADASSTAADRAAVATLYDTFDDRYLGNKTTDPTLDNDGSALLVGAIYFNTTLNHTRFYNGAAWEDPEATSTSAALSASTSAANALTSENNAAATLAAALPKAGGAMTGAITTTSTFDGRDVSVDGTKLDGIEALADVTDTTNVTAAGAAMLTGATFTGAVTATDFIGPLDGAVQFTAKNTSGGTINKGQAIAISGISGNTPTVTLADADATTMPAFGLAATTAADNLELEIVTFGSLKGVQTDYIGWALGDTLYISTTAGALTNVPPTGEAAKIQNIGIVERLHSSNGTIKVGGAGRSNATPNLNDGNVFIGNASNQSVSRALVVEDTTGLQSALDLTNATTTKADFFAQAEKRIRDNAGSGFAEWGKTYAPQTYPIVNEGIWERRTNPNKIILGSEGSNVNIQGVSRTGHPTAAVNGAQHNLSLINSADEINLNKVVFPPAPDGTKTYDSATGVVTEHGTSNEAFGGAHLNHDFRLGDNGDWTVVSADFTIGVGYAEVPAVAATTSYLAQTNITIGVEYDVTIYVESLTGVPQLRKTQGSTGITLTLGLNTIRVTAIEDKLYIRVGVGSAVKVTQFAAMPATESVITSRQDFIFLESFHEKISDKDVVYPLGNVQYGASSWEGITLSNTVEAQGYSAFGEWDTATKGYGVVWSTLSDANKAKFLQDPENNIYNDDGELIQVRYRVRVVEGLGDEWQYTDPQGTNYLRYSGQSYPKAQGMLTGDLGYSTSNSYNFMSSNYTTNPIPDNGMFTAGVTGSLNTSVAHNGLCFAVPIALVQRRNSGAYHPVYNSEGCGDVVNVNHNGFVFWHGSNAKKGSSKASYFTPFNDGGVNGGSHVGSINGGSTLAGRSDGKFNDAIYASDVQDLRMSSKRLPRKEIREKYKRMAIAGDVRGYEGVPFTEVHNQSITTSSSPVGALLALGVADSSRMQVGDIVSWARDAGATVYSTGWIGAVASSTQINVYNNDRTVISNRNINTTVLVATQQTHKQASPTWTDIIGSPANIAATFPQGVEGQWVPDLTLISSVEANRKWVSIVGAERTLDNGGTWTSPSPGGIASSNRVYITDDPMQVALLHYETQAHFTSDDVNSEVLDLGGVSAINSSDTRVGTILESSLINKIGTSSTSVDKGHEYSLIKSAIWYPTGALEKSSILPEHAVIDLSTVSPAVKTLDYLSESNGVGKLMYAYKEMVWDSSDDDLTDFVDKPVTDASTSVGKYHLTGDANAGVYVTCIAQWNSNLIGAYVRDGILRTSSFDNLSSFFTVWNGNGFGDNNKFEITNNQATQTDDNGNTVKYGTASFNTQYFIVEE